MIPKECYEEYGKDLDGCSTQSNEGCGRCSLNKNEGMNPALYGNSTTEINLDYYHELKEKADKWDEKETPKEITVTRYETFTSESCGNCGKTLWNGTTNYCYHCGQKIDWRLK